MVKYIGHFFFGIYFGFILIKTEVISWFRIQEMFRFDSFYMYGVIITAIIVGSVSVQLIKFLQTNKDKPRYNLTPKVLQPKANLFGGILFGLGWAFTGACPGPIYALIGAGFFPFVVVLISALAGTFAYALLKDKLPH
jgi:uncharacterized membrane protein YedE/YeeE